MDGRAVSRLSPFLGRIRKLAHYLVKLITKSQSIVYDCYGLISTFFFQCILGSRSGIDVFNFRSYIENETYHGQLATTTTKPVKI